MNAAAPQTTVNQRPPRKWLARLLLLGILGALMLGLLRTCYLVVRKIESGYATLKAAATVTQEIAGVHFAGPMAPKAMAKMQPCAAVDSARLAELRRSQAAALIPIVPGLVLDHTWVYYNVDIETLTRIPAVDEAQIQLTMSGQPAHAENGIAILEPSVVAPGYPQCQADLLFSHIVAPEFNTKFSFPLAGVTRIGVSREVYEDLKAGRKTSFEYRSHYHPVADGYSWDHDYHGEIQRDVLAPFTYKAILNGTLTPLPALHAVGLLDGNPVHLAVLDDPADPILLDIEMTTPQFALRVTKIEYPETRKIESELQANGRAEVYGIYFDFDSAVIRPESETVLNEIAQALRQNTGWELSIEGHTDSIGGDGHNLELSQHRAEAVKKALTDQYSIAPDRLGTNGFGASRPKATNETVEGRALNRRVELVRR